MNPKDFHTLFHTVVGECSELLSVKGGEYVPTEGDSLSNFKESARRMHVIPEKSLLILADKHWASICNYVHDIETGRQRPRSEPIYGRLNDLVNYMILLRGLLTERSELSSAIADEGKRLHWDEVDEA